MKSEKNVLFAPNLIKKLVYDVKIANTYMYYL